MKIVRQSLPSKVFCPVEEADMRVNKCNEGGGAGVGMLLPGETGELSRDSGLWAEFWETLETNRAPVRNKNSDFRQFFWHVAYNFSKGIIIKSDFHTNSLPFASLRTDEDACKLSHYLQIFSKSLQNKVTFKKLIQPSSKYTDSLTLVFIFFLILSCDFVLLTTFILNLCPVIQFNIYWILTLCQVLF